MASQSLRLPIPNGIFNPLKIRQDFHLRSKVFAFVSPALREHKMVSPFSVRAMGSSASSQKPENVQAPGSFDYKSLSEEDWKKRLTNEQFYITRQKGTERAFTGAYWNTKTPGIYHCICCDTPLFESSTKFDGGTGWSSYYQPIDNNVKSTLDMSIIFMPREDVLYSICDAHLAHVFNDGPPPTGKRYCINRYSLLVFPSFLFVCQSFMLILVIILRCVSEVQTRVIYSTDMESYLDS